MLLGAVLVPSIAYAQSGTVAVNGGTSYLVPSSQTTLSVPITISGSDALNGFSILVSADPTVLLATSVSVSGSVLPSPVIVTECINGVLVTGNTCSAQDTLGVVDLAAATVGSLTTAPTSGLLFTVNYNIVGLSGGTPISFTTGCTNTSVSGDCVTVTNGTPTPVPETDQSVTFDNNVDFTMTPVFTHVSTTGTAVSDTINYAAVGGYSDSLSETCSATAGLTCTLSKGSIDLISQTTDSDTATISGTSSGSVTVTATGAGFCPCGVVTHSVTIPVLVAPADFALSLSQSSVTVARGNGDSSTTISLAGHSGFTGSVSFSSSGAAGITGTASPATLTPDGSGYSTASSTLTIAVGPSVATGTYTVTVTGMSGSATHSATIMVTVPGQDFSIAAVPNSLSIIRGGAVVASLNVGSLGNFAGTVTLTVAITNQGADSCCSTTNITPSFVPASAVVPSGGNAIVSFFASTVGGSAPASTYTATGNYTATITATSGSLTHTATITFNVEDFTVGPAYCNGGNFLQTTPDATNTEVFNPGTGQAGVFVGTQCNSLTITDEPHPLAPEGFGNQILWVQVNDFGGLFSDGFDGIPAVGAINQEIPGSGVVIPSLNFGVSPLPGNEVIPPQMCLLPTFWPNGTQIPYSYLATHGPLITPGTGLYIFFAQIGAITVPAIAGNGFWGCKFDAAAFPNDLVGVPLLNHLLGTNFPVIRGNPDVYGVTAMSIAGTLPGAYTFKLCGQAGVLQHCNTYTLNVVHDPSVHQFVSKRSYSFAATGGLVTFKLGVQNNDASKTIYVQVTATGTGSAGDTFTATTGVVAIAPGAAANNLSLSTQLTAAEIGESFTFTVSMSVGTDPTNLDGTSTLLTVSRTFVLTA